MSERDKLIWQTALTLANNICVQISDRYNADDDIENADASNHCAKSIVAWMNINEDALSKILSEAGIEK
jgi:hypothetical protein